MAALRNFCFGMIGYFCDNSNCNGWCGVKRGEAQSQNAAKDIANRFSQKNNAPMVKKFLFVAVLSAFFMACGGEQPADTTQQTGQPQTFGEVINTDGAVSLAEMVTKLQGADSVQVKVKGTVESVCQVKGCWVNLHDETAGDIFVKFKDYGFFLPKDIAGREVVMSGYAFRETTSVEDLKHYAEDEGKSQAEIDAITEPKAELKFMADGVVLLPDTKK